MLCACSPGPKFHNLTPTPLTTGGVGFWRASWAFFFEDSPRVEPEKPLPYKKFVWTEVKTPYAVVWLGHASVLLKFKEKWIFLDPILSERLSHWTGVWPKRFHPSPVEASDLPPLFAVVISHDHQDHLDEYTLKDLVGRSEHYIVPKDVGAYLVDWGVDKKRVRELSWWESLELGELTFTCTPARHGSGRYPFDWDQTLWSGWTIKNSEMNVFFAGDTGMFKEFSDIGERLGPFDLTLMPIGAYDVYWSAIHMNPEEAVLAHQMVKGKKVLPIHYGTFDLSRHAWDEPMERFKKASTGLDVWLPLPGEWLQLIPATR